MRPLTVRTLLAYLIAPITTPVLVAAFHVAQDTHSWPASGFAELVLIGCLTAYPLAWGIGTIVLLTLRSLGKESWLGYTGCAALAGVAYGLILTQGAPALARLHVTLLLALLAAPTGAVFHALRRAPARQGAR